MPRRKDDLAAPRTYMRSGTWPDGSLLRDAPPAARYAQEIAKRLGAALESRNISAVASDCKLARSTLYSIVSGAAWPDVVSLAKLETQLRVSLWPDEVLVDDEPSRRS